MFPFFSAWAGNWSSRIVFLQKMSSLFLFQNRHFCFVFGHDVGKAEGPASFSQRVKSVFVLCASQSCPPRPFVNALSTRETTWFPKCHLTLKHWVYTCMYKHIYEFISTHTLYTNTHTHSLPIALWRWASVLPILYPHKPTTGLHPKDLLNVN